MKNNKLRKKNYTPTKEELKVAVIKKMKELKLWDDKLIEQIPTCWDNFKNYVVFNSKYFSDEQWSKAGNDIWECVSKLFSYKSIALQGRINNDDFRSPNAKIVFGSSPWIEYFDNRIWYTWNIEFTMFCSGNVSERHRVAKFDCAEEIVVDMFAGIGYFTLPYLLHAKAKHVFACEWNPKSVEALKLNLAKNKVAEKCTVLEGDVTIKGPRLSADRINMGLIPSCERYWPVAAEILKPAGGKLHVHGNVTSLSRSQDSIFRCEQCHSMLQTLSVDVSDTSVVKQLGGFVTKTVDRNVLGIELTNAGEKHCLKWNRIEWFVWSIHTCHSFCGYLTELTNSCWIVKPTFLHRVKAYAPHIDHLVLDICCENSMTQLS